MKRNNSPNNGTQKLEPRVAKLEEGMERLTTDVQNLANIVREQGNQIEGEIQKLMVAVTQAAGPRKTDWSTIFAGLMLVFAIGSAVFWPLNQISQDNKLAIQAIEEKFIAHGNLTLHPVGQMLVNRIEEQAKFHYAENQKNHDKLEVYLNEKMSANVSALKTIVEGNQAKNDLHNDRLYARVLKLEEQTRIDVERERDELQLWRQNVMGLKTSNGTGHIHADIPPTK